MQEIKLSIPDGCKTAIINLDGGNITTTFEPREEWKPKDGDFVTSTDGVIVIYADTNKIGGIISYAGYWNRFDNLTTHTDTGWGRTKSFRPATDKEKQLLVDKLTEAGYRWNPDKKELERLPRWQAKKGQEYFYINSMLVVSSDYENVIKVNRLRYECGNYFKTSEAAEKAAEQIRDIFKNLKAE